MRSTDTFLADQAHDKKLTARWGAATMVIMGLVLLSIGLSLAAITEASWSNFVLPISVGIMVLFGILDWRKAGRIHE